MIKTTERGWAGHFICADRCLFKRNTLIEGDHDSVVVSTVGSMRTLKGDAIETIGAFGRYYETMVFGAHEVGGYIDANVSDKREFESDWCICADSVEDLPEDVDNKANDMHDKVVAEFVEIFLTRCRHEKGKRSDLKKGGVTYNKIHNKGG